MKNYRAAEIESSEVRLITPPEASKLLESNIGNRKLMSSKIQEYARIMREGSWMVTHQGIAISSGGNLIDGQHRLAAVVMYGKPVRFLVVTMKKADDSPDDLSAIGQPIDIGKRRSLADILNEERKYVEIARTLIRDLVPNGNPRAQDPETVGRVIELLCDSMSYVLTKCGHTGKYVSMASVKAVMVLRHAQGIDCTENYANALRSRWDLLPKSWNSWGNIVRAMGGAKNMEWRRKLMAYTWSVTDPEKNEDKFVLIRDVARRVEEVSQVFQDICLEALVKRNPEKAH